MTSAATNCLLNAIRAEPASTIAIECSSGYRRNDMTDCCRQVLALMSQPGGDSVDSPVLFLVAAPTPYVFPVWVRPLVQNVSPITEGVWRLRLVNGQALIFAMTSLHDDAAICRMHALLAHLPDVSAVLLDAQLVQTLRGPKQQYDVDLTATGYNTVPVAMIHPCSYLDDASLIRDQSRARQTLRVFALPNGELTWQPLLYPSLNWRELTVEENQRLVQVCLQLNQHEGLILDKWQMLERQMQRLRAEPGCWFNDYEIECPIDLVLRDDDPRWRESDDNFLLRWPYDGIWSPLLKGEPNNPAPHDYRDAIPDLPAVLQEQFIGRLFYCACSFASLSWRDIAAIGEVQFDLTIRYQCWSS